MLLLSVVLRLLLLSMAFFALAVCLLCVCFLTSFGFMKVSCLFVPDAVTTPLSRALMARCFFSSCSFSIVDYRLEIEVASWGAFLALAWGAFAAVSRGSWPAAMACEWHFLVGSPSVPVWLRYDPICGGLRYGRCAVA